MSTVATSAISLLSCAHGKQRRLERNIDRRDLQAALKHGTRTPARDNRWKCVHDGVVYITDHTLRKEITSYRIAAPDIMPPIALTSAQLIAIQEARLRSRREPDKWTSHTVLVLDGSGSMKKDDVADAYNRADAMWVAVALGFVAEQLERGRASSTDVVTIISMAEGATTLCEHEPLTWSLLNEVLGFHKTCQPRSHGCYLPALDEAERVLTGTAGSQCALGLLFLSDGCPSDAVPRGAVGSVQAKHVSMVRERVGAIACGLGRRLTVAAIGFGPPDEDFAVLRAMAEEAEDFGAISTFKHAGLSSMSLERTLSRTLSRTLTATRTELTELTALGVSRQRQVREVRRESRSSLLGGGSIVMTDWSVYRGTQWRRCIRFGAGVALIDAEPFAGAQAVSVMVHERIFGEGAERMVHRFHELDAHDKPVGPPLVAKETRFVEAFNSEEHVDYHRVFCLAQTRASSAARLFNQRVALLNVALPHIEFLEPRVYVVHDQVIGEYGLLVEKRLDPAQYMKWNNNFGFVRAQATPPPDSALGVVGAIAESNEESDEEREGETPLQAGGMPSGASPLHPAPEHVPQAFTHFSYEYSRGKAMVCDLQGVFTPAVGGASAVFELTDPVIHYIASSGRQCVYGRTDRGRAGMDSFFATHVCNPLCSLLGLQARTHASQESAAPSGGSTAASMAAEALARTTRTRASRKM